MEGEIIGGYHITTSIEEGTGIMIAEIIKEEKAETEKIINSRENKETSSFTEKIIYVEFI